MSEGIVRILLQILFAFNIFFALVIVFFEKKNPGVTWAWLMVVLFLPYGGFIVYLMLGFDSRKYITFSRKAKMDEKAIDDIVNLKLEGLRYLGEQRDGIDAEMAVQAAGTESYGDLVYLNFAAGKGYLTYNNSITVYNDGNQKFQSLFQDISQAEKFIHMEYYIFRSDNLGKRIIAALAQKAAEGVEVRLFVDGMGNLFNRRGFYSPLLEAGGKLAIFIPPMFIRMNFRNHRKICVIDGRVGYVGGLNVGDEYLGQSKKYSNWRDSHIRFTGDGVKELELRFICDWNFSSKDKIIPGDFYFPLTKPSQASVMQIVSGGPDTKLSGVYYGYSKMISEAEKSIYIQTPYFAPDDNIFETLRIAALAGIDVRIVIPANPDHPFVYWASLSYLGELIKAGVKCYEYTKGFIHSKLVIIDGAVVSTGTANMDLRSFKLNFEINAFIYDKNMAEIFEKNFFRDLEDCDEITQERYNNRSKAQKIKESFSRLLSPLL